MLKHLNISIAAMEEGEVTVRLGDVEHRVDLDDVNPEDIKELFGIDFEVKHLLEVETQKDVLIKKTMIVSKKSQSMKNCTPNAKESYIGKFLFNSYFLLINNQRKKAIKLEPLKHDYI